MKTKPQTTSKEWRDIWLRMSASTMEDMVKKQDKDQLQKIFRRLEQKVDIKKVSHILEETFQEAILDALWRKTLRDIKKICLQGEKDVANLLGALNGATVFLGSFQPEGTPEANEVRSRIDECAKIVQKSHVFLGELVKNMSERLPAHRPDKPWNDGADFSLKYGELLDIDDRNDLLVAKGIRNKKRSRRGAPKKKRSTPPKSIQPQ